MSGLEAHAKPPTPIRDVFKSLQRGGSAERTGHDFVEADATRLITVLRSADHKHIGALFETFTAEEVVQGQVRAYEHKSISGLYYFPSLLPPSVQLALLDKLFNRDLLQPVHQTNVHAHYRVQYPTRHAGSSFFDLDRQIRFDPRDPTSHKPLLLESFLERKLRWMTLGGQYDWTNKVYPSDAPPAFPADIKQLIDGIFNMRAEAAIVNLYSPGDTLSLHRDVSEMCNQPLVSLSIGCECIFVVGIEDSDGSCRMASMTLRSGDAVLMSGESRFAWHGVPKILPESCPEWLRQWPGDQHPQWAGWMGRKRININVRQMFD